MAAPKTEDVASQILALLTDNDFELFTALWGDPKTAMMTYKYWSDLTATTLSAVASENAKIVLDIFRSLFRKMEDLVVSEGCSSVNQLSESGKSEIEAAAMEAGKNLAACSIACYFVGNIQFRVSTGTVERPGITVIGGTFGSVNIPLYSVDEDMMIPVREKLVEPTGVDADGNEVKYIVKTRASAVMMEDGTTVEAAIAALKQAVEAIQNA